MEVLGFFYEKAEDKIPANGYPITQDLLNKGYVQKDNIDGEPRWYVKRSKVWIILEINGGWKKFDIYNNIMAIYPGRQRITLKLAQEAIFDIINGKVNLIFRDGKPFLVKREPSK